MHCFLVRLIWHQSYVVKFWENLLYARSRVVHAAASAGLDVIYVPHLDLDDMDEMRIAAEQARDLGFAGKGSIHPKQISILNEVFTPPPAKIEKARRIIENLKLPTPVWW